MKGYSFRSLTDLVLKIFKTKVIAGTGLSGGGSLEADRTLSVKYGTVVGTATQGNDSRLSNSREWIGNTISQAEAEVGIAETRRAFTAQRVRQAIVAWWISITGTFGRDLVTSGDSAIARDKLGLFSSALRWPTWAEVTGKPTTFDPVSHTHPWSQVTGQPTTATRWPSLAEVTGKPANYPTTWNSVAAKPAQATRWPSWSEVTDKPIQQGLGNSSTNIMSQKATTDALNTKANTSTQVISGTGLSGGGDLSANRTLSVDYGSTAGTAAQGNDSRIVNSVQTSGNQAVAGIKTFSSFPVTPSAAPTANYQMANKKYVDDKVVGSAIGVGQTWQDVTGSRVANTTYTNNTGKPIMVSVSHFAYGSANNTPGVTGYVGNVLVQRTALTTSGGAVGAVGSSISILVPPGATYRILLTGTAHNRSVTWVELR